MQLIPKKSSELAKVLYSFRREFLWVGIFSMIVNILMLSPTLYMLQVYDRVLISQSELTLLFLTLIIIFFVCLMAFSEWLRSRLLVRVAIKLDQDLNSRIFNASFEAQLGPDQNNLTNAFLRLTNMRQFLTSNGIVALFDAPWTPIYIFIVFMLHPLLGVLSIFFVFVQLCMAYIGYRMTYPSAKAVSETDEKSRKYLSTKLRNAESVEAMGMLDGLRARWLLHHVQYQVNLSDASNMQLMQQSITKFVRYTMQSLTLGAAALLVLNGELSAGAMIASNILITRALQPIDLMVSSWKGFAQAREDYRQLDKLLKTYPERETSDQYSIPTGQISLKQLVASTSSRNKPILRGLNAEFKAGMVTVIIGPSGSGKSTLARCLVGIWPDRQGAVLLDETPIEHWGREQLGQHIGYLPQDVELFEGTLAENISRFNEIDSEKIVDAAKRAGIHDMILKFPLGYNTLAGEAGQMLSGGQKQRLGLARAIYGNPSIIVLDEPNSNLDDAGERALMQAIQNLKQQGATLFLITHRLNILALADSILVLRDGGIMHYGAKNEVLVAMKSKPQSTPANDKTLESTISN